MSPDILNSSHLLRDNDGRLIQVTVDKRFSKTNSVSWLVACDGSTHAEKAIEKSLSLLNIVHTPAVIHVVNIQSWLSKEAAEHELLARGWQTSQAMRLLLDEHKMNWSLHVIMSDDITHAILTAAQELNCCGIIVGNKGLGETEALLLGSIANQVVHQSSLPVLVVH